MDKEAIGESNKLKALVLNTNKKNAISSDPWKCDLVLRINLEIGTNTVKI